MKVLIIGDPHGSDKVKKIPVKDINLILVPGDLGKADIARGIAFEDLRRRQQGLPEKEHSLIKKKRAFMESYNTSFDVIKYLAKFAPVYTIFGNVESSNDDTRRKSKELGVKLPFLANDLNALDNVRVINNRITNFNGIRIGGLGYFTDTGWVRDFDPTNKRRMRRAKRETEKAKRILNRFGNVDILLCHQPPYGILDEVTYKLAPKDWKGKHAGSKVILSYMKKEHPRYVVCGHIHEGKGRKKIGDTEVINSGVAGDYAIIEI